MSFNGKLYFARNICIALVTTFVLAACGDDSKPQSKSKASGAETPQVLAGAATPIDPLGPRYQATLSDGITFNRDGYPSFVSAVKGIAEKETFGRWTDGSSAVIEFTQALPKNFTLKIKAGVFAPWRDMPIRIIVGNSQLETRFNKEEPTEVAIPVTTDGNAKSVTIEFPNAKSPKELGVSPDTRKLGLALVRLQIE